MNKRKIIHEKLEVMKECYRQRDLKNLDLIYSTFFNDERPALLLGTDNGEWFHTRDQIYELFTYDWQHWGDVSIDTYGFALSENGPHTLARVRALLDFHEDRAWDVDILMVFEEYREDLVCRLMMFKIPRNMIRPTVKINNSPVELSKYETEQKDLLMLHEENAARISPVLVEELPEIIRAQALQQRPDWIDISVPREQAIALCEDGRHFYFAGTGLCAVLKEDCTEEKDLLPFRMVGLGNVDGQIVTLADSELSHPFFTPLG